MIVIIGFSLILHPCLNISYGCSLEKCTTRIGSQIAFLKVFAIIRESKRAQCAQQPLHDAPSIYLAAHGLILIGAPKQTFHAPNPIELVKSLRRARKRERECKVGWSSHPERYNLSI
jgi:hypothetical protein